MVTTFKYVRLLKGSDNLGLLPVNVENRKDWLSMQQGRFRLGIRRSCLAMMIVNHWLCWEAVNLHRYRFSRVG